MTDIVERLLQSDEPSIRYKARIGLMGLDDFSDEADALREEIRRSQRVQALLSERDSEGRIPRPASQKWRGAHWVLMRLADLGYPPGDESLWPLVEQDLQWLYSKRHQKQITSVNGRVRHAAAQEAGALYAMLTLGLFDERVIDLATRLLRWQWPDGGWNSDRTPETDRSSLNDTHVPLRALGRYARFTADGKAGLAAHRASEVLLMRDLFERPPGRQPEPTVTELYYPWYAHYDLLFALRIMMEVDLIRDPRCGRALDLLEAKRLPDGGFPAEIKYYHAPTDEETQGESLVDWGGTSSSEMNEWVTVEALTVLRAAGRL